jgi:anti-sigma B factor antagonist
MNDPRTKRLLAPPASEPGVRFDLPGPRIAEQQVLTIGCGFHTDAVVVTASGEIDIDTAPELERGLVAALDAATAATPAVVVVVDLTGVTHLDSTGLNMLVRCNDLGRRRGVRLRVVASTRRVLRPVVATELDRVLTIYPTLGDALETVS